MCGAPRPTYLPVVAHSAVDSPVKSLRAQSHPVITPTFTVATYYGFLLRLLTMAPYYGYYGYCGYYGSHVEDHEYVEERAVRSEQYTRVRQRAW